MSPTTLRRCAHRFNSVPTHYFYVFPRPSHGLANPALISPAVTNFSILSLRRWGDVIVLGPSGGQKPGKLRVLCGAVLNRRRLEALIKDLQHLYMSVRSRPAPPTYSRTYLSSADLLPFPDFVLVWPDEPKWGRGADISSHVREAKVYSAPK